MQSVSIGANGFVFDGYCSGKRGAEAVLLLHGFPQTAYVWRNQLAALADAGYYAVALNQRGVAAKARRPPSMVTVCHCWSAMLLPWQMRWSSTRCIW